MSVTVKSVKPAGFWQDAPRNIAERYNELLPRDARLATPGQLRHLEGLVDAGDQAEDVGEGYGGVQRVSTGAVGIGDLLWIRREEAGKIEHLLRVMKKQ